MYMDINYVPDQMLTTWSLISLDIKSSTVTYGVKGLNRLNDQRQN